MAKLMMMRSVNGLMKVGLVIPGEISAEQTGSIWLNICNSPRRAKDLELNAELCIAGRSDIISPVCGQFVRKSESHRRDLWGSDTHSITYVPASTSLTLPIPLGTRFCDAFLALSAGRDGRGDMGTGREEGGGEAEEALYWLWTGGRAEEGHVQRGKNRGQSGKGGPNGNV